MRQVRQYKNRLANFLAVALVSLVAVFIMMPQPVSAGKICGGGGDESSVNVTIDFGCQGKGNPITDAAFAIIRFLSIGVGLIIVGSLTYAGIQYTVSRGDPKATAEAIGRVKANIIAFLIFLFAFAILNYIIPQGFIGL